MVALDYQALIDSGTDTWNRWRAAHPEIKPDLAAIYLYERSLCNINFSGANLSRACLIGADLSGADLSGADLTGVYANTARFKESNLTDAQLQGGNFAEANFTQANLSGTTADKANFTGAILTGTCLDGRNDPTEPAATQVGAAQTLVKGSPLRLPVALGVGAVALSSVALVAAGSAIYLITRPTASSITIGTVSIALVCDEPALPKVNNEPTYVYADGTQFFGEFIDGKPADGRGSMVYPNGNRYDGEYRGGQRSGCGTFTFASGRQYMGEFANDLFSGRGKWTLENGDHYLGNFEYNRCSGEGVYVFADGTTKSGIWQQGRLLGEDVSCDRTDDSPMRTPVELPTT
ncbi:MAG: pentapeptide repeat-containing protein [Cyanobacteria bacterium J06648_16]